MSEGISNSEQEKLNASVLHAKEFLASFGIGTDDVQVEKLTEWQRSTIEDSIIMSTEELFYQKVIAASSLWEQQSGETINYLFGKGTGVEIALRGNVIGREKNPVVFPYRSHSDFELYNAKYRAEPNGAIANQDDSALYPQAFKEIFGAQEIYPTFKTKGLNNIPQDLMDKTCERVDLGGEMLLIPQLELLFLDKYVTGESTPRQEGTDAELLAKQYKLDPKLLHTYLEEFVIQPTIETLTKKFSGAPEQQIAAIQRKYLRLKETNEGMIHEEIVALMNSEINDRVRPGVKYSGITLDIWTPISQTDIDEEGKLNEKNVQKIKDHFTAKFTKDGAAIKTWHTKLDEFLSML